MFENFKTDIIYFNSPTDFEMEFNLCGCCRMRLLNDKCSDKKSLLLSLSRAVSRSRIIMIVAPLFSADDIANTIASAIGSRAEIIDNEQFGINSDATIKIIKDSVPLVTADGIFGGCLIQSGPQTMVLLTDNKGVRKTIMQNLIHPYIKDLLLEKNPKIELPEVEETDPNQIIIDNQPETEENTEYTYPEEELPLVIDDEDEVEEAADNCEENGSEYYHIDYKGLYTESNSQQQAENPDDSYYDDDYFTDIPEEKPSAFNLWFTIISLILLITVAVLCVCIFYIPTKAGVEPSAYIKEIFDTMFV